MRWIRNIFAVTAISFLIMWLLSYFYVIGVQIPIKNDSGLTLSIFTNYTTFSIDHGGTPNSQADQWECDIKARSTILENVQLFNDVNSVMGSGPGLSMPEEYFTYGYETFNISDPGGKWTLQSASFTIPTWLPSLLFGLWPTIALTLHIKRRYFTQGLCRKCGYDLRGSPSGVCPECGWEPADNSNYSSPTDAP
jgi:hypothetical protein